MIWLNMEPLSEPRKLLSKARNYLDQISQSNSLEEQHEHWVEFLHILERFWNKLDYELSRYGKYQGWHKRGETVRLRKQDELLRYLKNARDVDEHSDKPITSLEPGGIGINPLFGGELIFSGRVGSDGSFYIEETNAPIKIKHIPDSVKAVEVNTRSGKHSPPTIHLGKTISRQSIHEFGRLGLIFYEEYLSAASELIKQK